MKNAWLNLTSLSQVSPIEKKLWIILFWIMPIELDMALTQKKGLAWITISGFTKTTLLLSKKKETFYMWL